MTRLALGVIPATVVIASLPACTDTVAPAAAGITITSVVLVMLVVSPTKAPVALSGMTLLPKLPMQVIPEEADRPRCMVDSIDRRRRGNIDAAAADHAPPRRA